MAHWIMTGFIVAILLQLSQVDGCSQGGSPVCGVDGNTYGNTCLAKEARVKVIHKGRCSDGDHNKDRPVQFSRSLS
ncbi:leech-derived tryptase inhibitor C-like [Paramacrobiotus metropolitanus]|uniref:leech-derived tryptase inhibitor C-like n=1 Tax=Paramacrobiotus metropolitanus TaxID=2943436 RepID=UPI002445F17B|nr:leech-derived tryptase inhibitor C-like [Paramacrobiotus metropolitanus]